MSLFFSTEVLSSNVAWLSDHGYRVVHLEASEWRTEQDMHADLALALNFPDYYGRNLDALNDCLSDAAGCEYGFSEADAGLVLVMRGIDRFMQRKPHLRVTSWTPSLGPRVARLSSVIASCAWSSRMIPTLRFLRSVQGGVLE